MGQAELELQLKVWKDLAVSKQMLIRAATDALKLDPDCSPDELKAALENAIKRAIDADASIKETKEQARIAIEVTDKKLADSNKALATAETANAELRTTQETLEQRLTTDRTAHAKELKTAKDKLAESERALKSIKTALGDAPENVLKKLKALNKQKMDEANARKEAEAAANTLRKEKRDLEKRAADAKSALENGATLAGQYRELHTLSQSLLDQLKPLAADAKELPELPVLDGKLLETVEQAAEAAK